MTRAPVIDGFIVRPFEDRDVAPLQMLFDADPDFFHTVNGGAGVGRRALHALYAWTREQGATALRLGVVEGNTRARWLYATEGFVFKGVREPDPTAKRMRRTLVLERPL